MTQPQHSTMTKITPLPTTLESVTVSRFVSPSSLGADPARFLRFQGRELDGSRIAGLLESPRAILGQVVHKAIEMADGHSNLIDVFDSLLDTRNEQLLTDSRRAHLAPLQVSVGNGPWQTARRVLTSRVGPLAPFSLAQQRTSEPTGATDYRQSEHEAFLSSDTLGLRGLADLIRHHPDGSITVTDWKIGAVTTEEGHIKLEYRLQLAAYLLLVREKWPDRKIKTHLFNGEVFDVEITEADLSQVRARVDLVRSALTDMEAVAARQLATVSANCTSCEIRHRCPVYVKTLTQSGRFSPVETPGRGRDVVGELRSFKPRPDGGIANIGLPDGSLVQLRGLSERFDLSSHEGEHLACFGFTPSPRSHRQTGAPLLANTYFETGANSRAWQAEIFRLE